jgi:TonB family protein
MKAQIPVRIWMNAMGSVARVVIEGTTGDPELDAAVRSVILSYSYKAPPGELPMPIVTRITARRPT